MVEEIAGLGRVTLWADRGYDRKEFVRELREHNVTPHIAQKQHSAIDQRTIRHGGYAISQTKCKRSKRSSAGSRPWAVCARLAIAESERVGWMFTLALAGYNLVRMRCQHRHRATSMLGVMLLGAP